MKMDETPLSIKRKKTSAKTLSKRKCIIHDTSVNQKSEIKPLTTITWQKIQLCVQQQDYSASSSKISEIIDNVPTLPDFFSHGFHRECYKRFTNIKANRKRKHCFQNTEEDVTPRKRQPSGDKTLFPSDECIICGKGSKWIRKKSKGVNKRSKLVKCVTKTSEHSLKVAASAKDDEIMLRKIGGEDLIAKEAHYHEECRKSYINISRFSNNSAINEHSEFQEAHKESFIFLADYIENEIIKNSTVVRISMLKSRYLFYLKENYPKSYNPDYSTQKL